MLSCAFIAGCAPPATSRSYVGTTKDTNWPYRYTLSQTNGVWAGAIERRGTNGWAFWDTMEIVEQQEHRIKFKARLGETDSFRPGWCLTWEKISPKGFSGMLTGDVFDSRMVELSLAPAVAEPVGTSNRGQWTGSINDKNYFAESPHIAVHTNTATYGLRWQYGTMGFFFQPEARIVGGQLCFSLQGTSSSGSLSGRYSEIPITDPKMIQALRSGDAYWLEPDGTKVSLVLTNL